MSKWSNRNEKYERIQIGIETCFFCFVLNLLKKYICIINFSASNYIFIIVFKKLVNNNLKKKCFHKKIIIKFFHL